MTGLRRAAVVRKPERRQLAKSELWLHLALTADRWAREVGDTDNGRTIPFAEWPADDPMRALCATYDLTPADLAKVLRELGEHCETAALRAGYDRAWIHPEDKP